MVRYYSKDSMEVDKQSIQASVRELVSQNYASIKPSLSLSITPIYSPANLRCKLLENDCWTVAEFQQIRDAWVAENSHVLVRIDESYFNMECQFVGVWTLLLPAIQLQSPTTRTNVVATADFSYRIRQIANIH